MKGQPWPTSSGCTLLAAPAFYYLLVILYYHAGFDDIKCITILEHLLYTQAQNNKMNLVYVHHSVVSILVWFNISTQNLTILYLKDIYQSYALPSLVGGGWGILGGGDGHGTLFHFWKSDSLIVNNKILCTYNFFILLTNFMMYYKNVTLKVPV